MTGYSILLHPDIPGRDLRIPDRKTTARILNSIETRLSGEPEKYGAPLHRSLKGYWKLRVGDWRVVFRIVKKEVWVFGVGHRRSIYDWITRRADWVPPAAT